MYSLRLTRCSSRKPFAFRFKSDGPTDVDKKKVSKRFNDGPSLADFIESSSIRMKNEELSESIIRKSRAHIRLPEWLKTDIPCGGDFAKITKSLRSMKLHTVCEEARCPNIGECWTTGKDRAATATIMIMGDTCTRGCRFCSVKTSPHPAALDPDEPLNTAKVIADWPIDYVVITSVDRDDIPDGGASHIAETVRQIKKHKPSMLIECLVPDFQGNEASVRAVIDSGLEVYAHNVETVRSFQKSVRDRRANYDQSMATLSYAKHYAQSKPNTQEIITKTSIMLGFGESDEEVFQTLRDLRQNNVDVVTFGQYVQPTRRHLKVREYVHPTKFDYWAAVAKELGFLYVASGPLVRSSYKAGEYYIKNIWKNKQKQK